MIELTCKEYECLIKLSEFTNLVHFLDTPCQAPKMKDIIKEYNDNSKVLTYLYRITTDGRDCPAVNIKSLAKLILDNKIPSFIEKQINEIKF